MLVHDAFSSVGVTRRAAGRVRRARRLALRGPHGLAGRVRAARRSLRGRARARDAARQLAQLPWFARNVLFKVLVLAGLRPVAHRLGLPAGMHWPYWRGRRASVDDRAWIREP